MKRTLRMPMPHLFRELHEPQLLILEASLIERNCGTAFHLCVISSRVISGWAWRLLNRFASQSSQQAADLFFFASSSTATSILRFLPVPGASIESIAISECSDV